MTTALALAAFALLAVAASRPVFAAVQTGVDTLMGDDLQPGDTYTPTAPDVPAWDVPEAVSQALPGIAASQLPAPDTTQQDANIRAFLQMIRAAEGTAAAEGYGALFGWPAKGRSFDPAAAADHPKIFFDYTDKAGKTIKTSAAGAYQITWTTWNGDRTRFRAWCARNGYSVSGFNEAAQDAFAVYLLDTDGALPHVKAGRFAQAVAVARRRWASLPGAGYNQPERSIAYVQAAYERAGGTVA